MFTSPKFIAGVLSGVALGATGSTLLLLSNKERSLGLRKRIATSIRDMADRTIENIDKAAQEVEENVDGEQEEHAKSARSSKKHKVKVEGEEPIVN